MIWRTHIVKSTTCYVSVIQGDKNSEIQKFFVFGFRGCNSFRGRLHFFNFCILVQIQLGNPQRMSDYLHRSYIGKERRDGTFLRALNPPLYWSCYQLTLEHLPRTTCSLEGFHAGFRQYFTRTNPSVILEIDVVDFFSSIRLCARSSDCTIIKNSIWPVNQPSIRTKKRRNTNRLTKNCFACCKITAITVLFPNISMRLLNVLFNLSMLFDLL